MDEFSESPVRHRQQELLRGMRDRYIPTRRDQTLTAEVTLWVDQTLASLEGQHPEGRILAVTGISGAGKTWAVERAIEAASRLGNALLCITAPRPCTLKQLGRAILTELGYSLQRDLLEHLTWEKVREHVEANGIRFIWIDELQHIFDGKSDRDLTAISDTIKNLVQRRRWPVSFLISGLPVVARFLGRDRQLERRSRSIEFGCLTFPAQARTIRKAILQVIVEQHAEMRLDGLDTDEFVHRLCHAGDGAFGAIVDLTRAAVFAAAARADFDGSVQQRDFATAYSAERGCEAEQNVFTALRWDLIKTENSRLRGGASC